MPKKLLRNFALLFGVFLAGLAIFAHQLGIDNDAGWGTSRILLLLLGLFALLTAAFFQHIETLANLLKRKFLLLLENSPLRRWINGNRTLALGAKLFTEYSFLIPVVLIVLIAYTGIAIHAARNTTRLRTAYYPMQARAFQEHKFHLPIEPSEKLLALSNPYDPSQRVGVGEPIDVSLYNGRFYLYWGPVPALILTVIKPAVLKQMTDLFLVWGFSCGLFLLQAALVLLVWDRAYSHLPRWLLVLSIVLAGFAGPTIWMIREGDIYEAAILGAQFFLLGGFLAAFLSVNESFSSNGRLVVTGALLVLAIGARLTIILPVGVILIMMAYFLWKEQHPGFKVWFQKMLFLGLPILFGLSLLAWYNWVRFGSLTETGFTYQLAGTYLQKHLDEIVSHRYIIQNLYNYLFAPFQLTESFPYIYSNPGSMKSFLALYELPEFYSVNAITGLLYTMPFVCFSFCNLLPSGNTRVVQPVHHEQDVRNAWLLNTLAGSILITLLFLLVCFWAAMRYIADFSFLLIPLSIFGYFRGYTIAKRTRWERPMVFLGVVVAFISIVMSIAMGMSNVP